MQYSFEYEGYGKKIIVVSLLIDGKNEFRDYLESLNENTKTRLLARISKIANDYGFEIRNSQLFEKLTNYNNVFEIKLYSPASHRILCSRWEIEREGILCLLLGFPKKSEKSTRVHRQFYKKAETIIQEITKEKSKTDEKLRNILAGIK